jgi:SAM-dependent methyltransferase
MTYLYQIEIRWALYLEGLESLREGIFLRAYGEKNPLTEYMRDAAAGFEEMLADIHRCAVHLVVGVNGFYYDIWKNIYERHQATQKALAAFVGGDGKHRRLISFYRTTLHTHGSNSAAAVAYTSGESQKARFKALLENTVPDKNGSFTLLDLGSGTGALYGYLQEQGYTKIGYTGIDLVSDMVRAAGEQYPAAHFLEGNFLTGDAPPGDIIVASGSLNFIFDKQADQTAHIEELIRNMYAQAGYAFAFNLLDKDAKANSTGERHLYYADKGYFLRFCKTLCKNALLVDGYLDNDFTIVMRK